MVAAQFARVASDRRRRKAKKLESIKLNFEIKKKERGGSFQYAFLM